MLIGDHWAVELEGFVKSYPVGWLRRPVPAVGPVSLTIARGQVLGLLGPNGSGKSTLLKALAGLIHPSAGHCRILNHPSGGDAARGVVGYLPESVRLPPYQTGREFLQYCAGLSSMSSRQAGGRVKAVIEWAGLGPAIDRRIDTYSKGMRQRMGLAQAVVHEPQVVLLDEPASGLDPEGRLVLSRLIRDLAAQGRTVIFSSHLLVQSEQLCDRIAIIGAGRLLWEGSSASLSDGRPAVAPALSRLEEIYLEKLHGTP